MDRFVKSGRERFVVASLDIFLDLTFCVFAEVDICHHFFMNGELIVCLQRNNINFHHVFLSGSVFYVGIFYVGCWMRGC